MVMAEVVLELRKLDMCDTVVIQLDLTVALNYVEMAIYSLIIQMAPFEMIKTLTMVMVVPPPDRLKLGGSAQERTTVLLTSVIEPAPTIAKYETKSKKKDEWFAKADMNS